MYNTLIRMPWYHLFQIANYHSIRIPEMGIHASKHHIAIAVCAMHRNGSAVKDDDGSWLKSA
jgi:hypothetical protein